MSVLERLKKLEEAATQGPWEVTKTSYPGQVLLVRGDAFTASTQLPTSDAKLIAEIRNVLPKLLAVVEAAIWQLHDNPEDTQQGLADALAALEDEK
jgi:hypothetical protein